MKMSVLTRKINVLYGVVRMNENEKMYDINVRDIIDDLIRMGLVKEVWYEGEDSPRYIAIEHDKEKAKKIIDKFNNIGSI